MKKECSKCFKFKKLDKFSPSAKGRFNVASRCKKCSRDIGKTKLGLLGVIFRTQVAKSKKRGHLPPKYSKEEFIGKYLDNNKYKKLHKRWVKSKYDTQLRPSFDRQDDNLGYSFENIKLVTWKENNEKGHFDVKRGVLRTQNNKAVLQYSKEGVLLNEFFSMAEASRKCNVHKTSISSCCKNKRKTAGGFIWKYKEDV